ncbi:hypothetical protein [Limnohabitans sp.]
MTKEDQPNFNHDPLGGDVFASGFDLPPEGSAQSLDEWEQAIEDWAGSNGKSESPLGDSWNTLPFGAIGKCCDHLFVDVRSAHLIQQIFWDTRLHLKTCPNTRLVVFHVGGDIGYLQWMNELIHQLPMMKKLSNSSTQFITRVSRSWMPRLSQNPTLWRGAIVNPTTPDHIDVAACFSDTSHRQKRVMLKHRVWLLEELGLLCHDFGFKPHKYQPTTPRSVNDISFGTLIGEKIYDWWSRVYLDDIAKDYPLGFNIVRTPPQPLAVIDEGEELGSNNGWIARDRIGFLINPYRWININNLPDHR